MGSLVNLRSLESRTQSPVTFINKTDRDVEIFWLNHSGQEISYGTLQPSPSRLSVKAINTFVTHPWIALDCESRQRLWLNSKEVFCPPQPITARIVVGHDGEQLKVKRANVFITKPVFNAEKLMDLCCRFVSKTCKPEDIDNFFLPNFVKTEIRKYRNIP